MQLHQLSSPSRKYPTARVGRGGKRGKTAGKGTKGQKARAGHRIRPAERDLIQRLPKRRGYANKPAEKPEIVHISALEKLNTLNPHRHIKILNDGEVKGADKVDFKKFTSLSFSKSAAGKLKKAGIAINE